ncbi:MAG: ABC transporter substrate-binding protein [Chloroflexota bacterium]
MTQDTQSVMLSRRQMLRVAGMGSIGLVGGLLAACSAPAPSAPAAPPAAAAPTTASAPPAAKTADSAAAATPTQAVAAAPKPAAAQPAAKPGKQLIGQIEGPSVVVDAAQFPKTFSEAPMLADLVKQGKLPPVQQRLPEEPLVIKPVHEIGRYGGTWRRGFTGPGDRWNGNRTVTGPDSLLFWDFTGETAGPNVAKGYEFQDGGRVFVLHLRKGMRWSDGEPFTADDFVFWYEDIYKNEELMPTANILFSINGKQGKLEKADDYTVRYVFPEPYFLISDLMAGSTPLSGHAFQGDVLMGSFAPAHYLKQFHPKYVSGGRPAVDQLAKDAQYDNWPLYFKFLNDYAKNVKVPTVTPWVVTSPSTTQQWTFERNPYYFAVDSNGNQLPYIDKVQLTLAENLEVLNLRAIAGEFDHQERHVDLSKLPVYLENQARGNYKVYLDPGDYAGDCIIKFNMSYEDDAELNTWFNTADFRRALSMGIDRDQLNEAFWLGLGTPTSMAPADNNKYNPGPEYRGMWATYDPAKANSLLDGVGLTAKDGEGFRQRKDGTGRLRLEITTVGGQFVQFTNIMEMVRQQWTKIGVDLTVQERERSLAEKMAGANQTQLYAWLADGSEHPFTFPDHVFPYNAATEAAGVLFAKWFQSGGTQGKEPPPKIKEVMDKFRQGFSAQEDERVKLGKEIWKTVIEETHVIATVGLSPAAQGTRIVKNTMGNIPARMYNSPDGKTPGISRTPTYYFKA